MNSKTQTRSCRFRVRTRQQLDRFGSVDGIVLRSLTQAVTIPIYGRLADLYGRKRVFLAGAGLFLFASALCGLAWGMLPLVLFRGLQGAGAGAIQPIAITIIGDIYRPTERARRCNPVSGHVRSADRCRR